MLFFNILILYCSLPLTEVADAYHTGKISPTCKTACRKDNKLFIWRKKSSLGQGRTVVKIKADILPCFAELLLDLTICCICNLYSQSLECKGCFYLQFASFFSNIQIQTSDEKLQKPTQQQLLGKAVHDFSHCVRSSSIVLCQACPSKSKMKCLVQ